MGTRSGRGLRLPARPALPALDSLHDSRPGHGRRRRRLRRARRRLHPARVRQEGPSGKEGTPPPPPRPHLGSAGGQGGRARAWLQRVWAASPHRPVGAARWAGRPPNDEGRKRPPGLPGTQPRAAGAGPGLGPPTGGEGRRGSVQGPAKPCEASNLGSATYQLGFLGEVISPLCPTFPTSETGLLITM